MTDSEGCPKMIPVPDEKRTFKDPALKRCGRPIKGDGLCGIHLGALRRREENARKRELYRKATVQSRRAASDPDSRLSS